ncbi:DNA polymerase alpha/epsilon subunit B-domain-containing protein [Gilbertella persicaria]|uniref:DNA polymerase alpha/epsilon subunit B-domain-containing protein n=1 Tax=Gilbertella persicaria TaxID=101096 RepID=UPI002220F3BB|nr:DNA polymerase alpha/epsilon subunit B-domain-containing protein [Gilbertella persicaria]KAI8080717.1 DNA polymerase alpha/epsilon subunit B-domain-containing protein [Gilbertella persicaria]
MAPHSKIKIKRSIYNLFTKKYGLHVQTDAAKYLESLLESEPDLPEAIEKIIKAYRKRYSDERQVIVDEATIREVISSIRHSAAVAASLTPFQREDEAINDSLQEMTIDEPPEQAVNVAQHFHVVSAFDLPRFKYDEQTRTFIKNHEKPSLLPEASEKGDMYRERYKLVKQRLLRNDLFCPTAMSGANEKEFIKITPIKSLIGHDEEEFVLFGMLTQMEEGKIHLEDEDAYIELVVNNAEYDYGLFTDGSFLLIEGQYGIDHKFHVKNIYLPPAESREMTDHIFGHLDFLGLPKSLVDEKLLKEEEDRADNVFFVIVSDVHLDQPKVMQSLRRIFEGYSSGQIPLAFIMMGNFSSKPFVYAGSESDEYKDNFSALADLISEFDELSTHTNFVFVPGPKDPWAGKSLPQRPILPSFVTRMKQKVRKAHFTTNPCRIRYCTQDIVVFREDWLQKMWRNALLPVNLAEDSQLNRHFIRSIVDQGHLSPLPLSVKPISWSFDNALRLFPLPHALIIADKCENYGITYEGTHCINPGSFPTSDFTWSNYYPHSRISERRQLQP